MKNIAELMKSAEPSRYVFKDGVLVSLYKDPDTGLEWLPLACSTVCYNEKLDGKAYTKEEVKEQWPEYLI